MRMLYSGAVRRWRVCVARHGGTGGSCAVGASGRKSDTAVAYVGEISEITVYDGSVAPYVEELYFPIDGQVSEIYVIVGQTVQAGDPLVALDQEARKSGGKTFLTP